jgi:hypothetical protein
MGTRLYDSPFNTGFACFSPEADSHKTFYSKGFSPGHRAPPPALKGESYTAAMANNMKEVALKLQKQGVFNSEEFNAIIALSNQGHKMGLIQSQLEDATRGKTAIDYNSTDAVQFEGKYYSITALGAALSGQDIGPETTNIDVFVNGAIYGTNYSGALTNQAVLFAEAYNSAKAAGALDNPGVKKLID